VLLPVWRGLTGAGNYTAADAVKLTQAGQSDVVVSNPVVTSYSMQHGFTTIAPGEYVLQVIVTDRLAKEKYRSATQWIDFEIVENTGQ